MCGRCPAESTGTKSTAGGKAQNAGQRILRAHRVDEGMGAHSRGMTRDAMRGHEPSERQADEVDGLTHLQGVGQFVELADASRVIFSGFFLASYPSTAIVRRTIAGMARRSRRCVGKPARLVTKSSPPRTPPSPRH
jgi:hypothetical protein